jgi:hypothetical protein
MNSTRNSVLASFFVVGCMSYLMGTFVMLGVAKLSRHDNFFVVAFLLIPLLAYAAYLHGRRIMRMLPPEAAATSTSSEGGAPLI